MKKIGKYIYNLNIFKKYRSYVKLRKNIASKKGQINELNERGKLLHKFIIENKFLNILEIGTWNGLGSTLTIINANLETNSIREFTSIESNITCYRKAKKNLKHLDSHVNLLFGKIIEVNELPSVDNIDFELFGFDPKNREWYFEDINNYNKAPNVLSQIGKQYDFILFDGGEFSTYAEFIKLWTRTSYFAIDDTQTYKQYEVLKFIKKNNDQFNLIYELNDFHIYEVLA
tara:strand:- start:200 stop:889 length:690 start_codon:yes stop_codon:yes gene_type:complete